MKSLADRVTTDIHDSIDMQAEIDRLRRVNAMLRTLVRVLRSRERDGRPMWASAVTIRHGTIAAALALALGAAPADGRVNRWKVVKPLNGKLERIAQCESGGRWWISTGNGYHGGLQFDARTWWSVGGRGLPHHHPQIEQKFRAVLLIRRRGYQPWPVCGSV